LKLFLRTKVIYDIHEDYPEEFLCREWIPKIFQNRLGKKLLEMGERFFAKFFNHLIFTTQLAAEKFKNFKEKITVIHNFPLLELYPGNSKEKKYDVIIVGDISKNRLLTILEIGKRLKELKSNFKWCIIGTPLDLINLGKAKVQKLNLKENFEFISRIPHHQTAQYLIQSKIGFIHLPPEKRFERMLPTKLFEYMVCGLPVVSSELPLIHKFTDSYQCVIQLPPNDISGFAEAINYLLSHPEKSKEMGERGKKGVIEKYNWSKEEIKLINLYEKTHSRCR
jgi:glycosyltransferase involved in cell wall biosynthesis